MKYFNTLIYTNFELTDPSGKLSKEQLSDFCANFDVPELTRSQTTRKDNFFVSQVSTI